MLDDNPCKAANASPSLLRFPRGTLPTRVTRFLFFINPRPESLPLHDRARPRALHSSTHPFIPMGDRDRQQQQPPSEAIKNLLPDKGPSGGQALAVATLLPVGGGLLALSGLTLVGSLIGLAVLTPVFLLFSPVLVPAALLAALAVAGFLGSGALGVAGLSSLGYLLRKASALVQKAAPEQVEQVRRRMGEVGQKAKDAAQSRAEESKRT